MKIEILPSLLAADFGLLADEIWRDDFPGTANGYNTIGIVNTGTAAAPVYNWLIDVRKHYGLSVIVR